MSKNERLQALRILMRVINDKTPLSPLLQGNKELTSLTKAICFGVCRHYFRLEAMADVLLDKRPPVLEIWLALLIGLFQLQFLNKPEYATVQETVALLDKLKKTWAKGLVNAVLRRFCRERDAIIGNLAHQPGFILGHPAWFVERMKKDWSLDWSAILTANDVHPPMSLRVNRQHSGRETYLCRLHEAGILARPHGHAIDALMLDTACDVNDLPGFAEGDVSVQDAAAQLAVSLLDLQPGQRVLDACAAPGGKTAHILEAQSELLACVALDIDKLRLQRVGENLKRLRLSADIVQGDALNPSSWWDGDVFDRILLDAPCSATGVIRRHPDIKLLRTEADIQQIASLQAGILQSLWPLLAPGGLLVYATCSIIRQENEQQIAHFLSQHADCQLATDPKPWGHDTGFGWQLLPGESECDGFFYSVLRKNNDDV